MDVLAPYSPEIPWSTYQRECIGTSDVAMVSIFCKLCRKPVTADAIMALYPKKIQLFHALTESESLVDRRIIETLNGLKGIDLAVVTSSKRTEVEPILRREKVLDVLTTVVYGNDVTHYKPHPEPYLLAMQRLGVAAAESVVFEDSKSGIRSGKAAGCRVVQVEEPARLPEQIDGVLSGVFDF